MKIHRTLNLFRGLTAAAGGFALFTGALHAAPFLYNSGDLVLAFRQTGNASDYVVNIGRATDYNAVSPGTSFTVANLSQAQLSAAFPSLNQLKWSVSAANRLTAQGESYPDYPAQTLWVTRPRTDANQQSVPWLRKSQSLQGNAGSQINAVGTSAASASSLLPGGANNNATGVVIPTDHSFNIGKVIGAAGNYVGNFQGNVEALTAEDFEDDSGNVSRADLYELQPGAGSPAGTYLGYFELKPNGTLTFNTVAPAPAAPTITSIVRNGDITTVSFTTQNGATYRLRSTDAAGLTTPVSTWAIGDSVAGSGSVLSLSHTTGEEIRFFAVEAE